MANHTESPGKLVTRAMRDEAFRKRLLIDPTAVLKEHGTVLPEGVVVKVVENTEKVCYIVIPHESDFRELTDDQLEKVAGGARNLKLYCGRAPD